MKPAPPPQADLFEEVETPVLAAWGAGVDSTAMIIELLARGERIDACLFADTGAEKPETYAWVETFSAWLAERGVPVHVVRYTPKDYKHFPPYYSLEENCLSNATLPGISFGRHTCSTKWKIAPQEAWTKAWPPAQAAWARGDRVVKLVGYDCSPADQKRYAHAQSLGEDSRYIYRYPLREFGWTRADCEARIAAEGFPPVVKSACWFCGASKPAEIDRLEPALLRRIVLMEARAKPRLRNVEGLWRKRVLGQRGATPRPGSMTEYIRERGLLPADEITAIEQLAPQELTAFQAEAAAKPVEDRPDMRAWLRLFDAAAGADFKAANTRDLYAEKAA